MMFTYRVARIAIINAAVGMVLGRFVERTESGVVNVCWSAVIPVVAIEGQSIPACMNGDNVLDHDVQHEQHSTRMQSAGEFFQVVGSPEVRVQFVEMLLPVTMICSAIWRAALDLRGDRRYPHRVEPHALDVVQVIRNTLVAAAAVRLVRGVARGARAAVTAGKPICEDLVYRSATPVGR